MKKTALVTGGSGGIGSEICRVLAEDGWQVAVCYKNGRAAAEALVSELKERGLCAEVFYCDIGDKDSIDKCVAEVRDSLGFVTLLVNNAGTADIELFTDMTDEKLCEMMNVNLLGAMRMSRAVLPWEESFQEASFSYAFRSKVSMSHRRRYTKSRITKVLYVHQIKGNVMVGC